MKDFTNYCLIEKEALIPIFLVLIHLELRLAVEWEVRNYPDPQRNPQECRGQPGKQSFLCDPDGVLSHKEGMYL